MSITLDLYEFRLYLIDHDKLEEFLLFVRNFEMNLAAMETLVTEVKVHYFCTLVRGEALRQFDLLSTDVENTDTSLIVDYLLKSSVWYFFL